MTLSTKQVFGVFCFQEQKTVLENTKQTGLKSSFDKYLKNTLFEGISYAFCFLTSASELDVLCELFNNLTNTPLSSVA